MKAIKILSDIKLSSDNMSLELHPNCTLDDVYQGIEEINKIISSKNNFKEYGFEADFEGEILKQIGDILYGVVYVEYFGRGVVCEWNTKGKVISKYKIDEKAFELKPIKKEWYKNPDNFPCLVIYDDKEIKLMGSYSETSKFRTEPCLLTAEGVVYHSLSKCRLATEEEALKLVKKV